MSEESKKSRQICETWVLKYFVTAKNTKRLFFVIISSLLIIKSKIDKSC